MENDSVQIYCQSWGRYDERVCLPAALGHSSWAGVDWDQHWSRAQREACSRGRAGSEGCWGRSSLSCGGKTVQCAPTVVLNEMYRINDFSDSLLHPPVLELILWFTSCSGVQFHASYFWCRWLHRVLTESTAPLVSRPSASRAGFTLWPSSFPLVSLWQHTPTLSVNCAQEEKVLV